MLLGTCLVWTFYSRGVSTNRCVVRHHTRCGCVRCPPQAVLWVVCVTWEAPTALPQQLRVVGDRASLLTPWHWPWGFALCWVASLLVFGAYGSRASGEGFTS
jgi:hypothetical protein